MKNLIVIFLLLSVVSANSQILTPPASPLSKLEQKVGLGTISLEYSRPGIKNRRVFGGLVPYDKMWRTGANSCTKITFSEDVKVEGKNLAKGTYALLSIPGETDWEFIFYTDYSFGGLPEKFDEAKVALRVSAVSELLPYTFESLLFDINDLKSDGATLMLIWENTVVPLKFSFDIDSKVQKNIDKVLAGPTSDDYYTAARYYLDNNKDMSQAIIWAQKANQMDPKFWKLRVESLILARLGRKTEAIEVANKSKTMAIAAGNEDYIKMNDDSIMEWSK